MVLPIHIHGVRSQVLERIRRESNEPCDLGWMDTIIAWGRETARVIMRSASY
jgi:FtsP/CotA-like multicopper oxidase with cupredoxin domain